MARSSTKSYEIDMCNGPILPKLLRFSIPLTLSTMLQLLFNAADVVVVGRYAGDNSLAAVGSNTALINLLTNAAKFTAKGSIRFGYRTEGSRLRFYVSDTGCGIPPEGQRRIFDRFVKLNSFKQGTGLGLPICKSIVEHLGGEIGVKSEEGRGTTFWFTLPYVTGKPCETPCGEIPTVSVEKDKLTILIAEDNDSNYRLFETILRRDYRLIHARDGEQAVELCRTEHPHLILMDINMPVMNGYEAAAEIRKFAAEIPIVAVTAYASDEQKIMQNGFTGYMPKPINAPQLKKQILDILRERITLI